MAGDQDSPFGKDGLVQPPIPSQSAVPSQPPVPAQAPAPGQSNRAEWWILPPTAQPPADPTWGPTVDPMVAIQRTAGSDVGSDRWPNVATDSDAGVGSAIRQCSGAATGGRRRRRGRCRRHTREDPVVDQGPGVPAALQDAGEHARLGRGLHPVLRLEVRGRIRAAAVRARDGARHRAAGSGRESQRADVHSAGRCLCQRQGSAAIGRRGGGLGAGRPGCSACFRLGRGHGDRDCQPLAAVAGARVHRCS